jgi:hypothetical protein
MQAAYPLIHGTTPALQLANNMSLLCQISANFFLLLAYRYVQSRSAFLVNNAVQVTEMLRQKLTLLRSEHP